uniref:Uncharacterized protein n=1 Tax=Arundo donax TaxID=35708 RepID=A0A0A9HG83_ARUDO
MHMICLWPQKILDSALLQSKTLRHA